MDKNTLHSLLVTVAQISAALSGLSIIFVQLKISDLQGFLIGTAKSVYKRSKNNDKGYVFGNESTQGKHLGRLRDSIYRKDISGISEEISLLADKEKEEGFSEESRKRGLQYVYTEFTKKVHKIKSLKVGVWRTTMLSFVIIIVNLLSLVLSSNISILCNLSGILVVLPLAGTMFMLFFLGLLIKEGLE